jgi:hypothetical protein
MSAHKRARVEDGFGYVGLSKFCAFAFKRQAYHDIWIGQYQRTQCHVDVGLFQQVE